jgi:hypothetical protein
MRSVGGDRRLRIFRVNVSYEIYPAKIRSPIVKSTTIPTLPNGVTPTEFCYSGASGDV